MKQKANLELYAVRNFIVEYDRTHKRQLHLAQPCKPPMPDTLCKLNGKDIGIEVVHTYGTGVEAAIRLGNRTSEDYPKETHRARRIVPLDVRAITSLNQILSDKGTRSYAFSPTWLLVRNAFTCWSIGDYHKHKSKIILPQTHPFAQIWFLCDGNSVGPRGIMRLV